jgi:hypothetical protein
MAYLLFFKEQITYRSYGTPYQTGLRSSTGIPFLTELYPIISKETRFKYFYFQRVLPSINLPLFSRLILSRYIFYASYAVTIRPVTWR